jgi:hypothetical protein
MGELGAEKPSLWDLDEQIGRRGCADCRHCNSEADDLRLHIGRAELRVRKKSRHNARRVGRCLGCPGCRDERLLNEIRASD